jgi:hypothetical protein
LITHLDTIFPDLNVAGAYTGYTPTEGYEAVAAANFLNDGTAPGRIRRTLIEIENTAAAKRWQKAWVGMKIVKSLDTYFAPIEPFDSVYGHWTPVSYSDDLELNITDTDALNDNTAEVQFDGSAGNDFEYKQSVGFPYETGMSVDNQRGTYLVLMRMRATTATARFRVAMFQSWEEVDNDGSLVDTYQDVFVESNEWHMYEMGTVQVPPEPFRAARRVAYPELYQNMIGYAAERLTAADGALRVDYLLVIPQEHALSIHNMYAGSGQPANVIVDEEDFLIGYTTKYTAGWEKYIHEIAATNWVWPADPNRYLIVVAAADTAEGDGHHEIAATIKAFDLNFYVIPRYFSYNAD